MTRSQTLNRKQFGLENHVAKGQRHAAVACLPDKNGSVQRRCKTVWGIPPCRPWARKQQHEEQFACSCPGHWSMLLHPARLPQCTRASSQISIFAPELTRSAYKKPTEINKKHVKTVSELQLLIDGHPKLHHAVQCCQPHPDDSPPGHGLARSEPLPSGRWQRPSARDLHLEQSFLENPKIQFVLFVKISGSKEWKETTHLKPQTSTKMSSKCNQNISTYHPPPSSSTKSTFNSCSTATCPAAAAACATLPARSAAATAGRAPRRRRKSAKRCRDQRSPRRRTMPTASWFLIYRC